MEIVCINAKFTPKQLELFRYYDIKIPETEVVYSIRDLIRTFNGSGILLKQIVNPEIPMKPGFYFEPNWALWRFTTLLGESLTISDILESLKSEKLNEGLELVTIEESEQLN